MQCYNSQPGGLKLYKTIRRSRLCTENNRLLKIYRKSLSQTNISKVRRGKDLITSIL